jgi:hypothetical protein
VHVPRQYIGVTADVAQVLEATPVTPPALHQRRVAKPITRVKSPSAVSLRLGGDEKEHFPIKSVAQKESVFVFYAKSVCMCRTPF